MNTVKPPLFSRAEEVAGVVALMVGVGFVTWYLTRQYATERQQDLAVEAGAARYYLDSDHRRQFKFLPEPREESPKLTITGDGALEALEFILLRSKQETQKETTNKSETTVWPLAEPFFVPHAPLYYEFQNR